MRIVPILLALILTVPFATAGLTDPIQNDPGTGGGDASDNMDDPTWLHEASKAGWMNGTVVAVDDAEDFYAVFFQADGTMPSLRVVVDPAERSDVALILRGEFGQFALVDENGPGRAETISFDDLASADGRPGGGPGKWTIGVLERAKTSASVPGATGLSGSGAALLDYNMALFCDPDC